MILFILRIQLFFFVMFIIWDYDRLLIILLNNYLLFLKIILIVNHQHEPNITYYPLLLLLLQLFHLNYMKIYHQLINIKLMIN